MSLLYSPVTLGPYTFKNRIAMSPMTRSRSHGNVPDDLVAEYYRQRAASAGLIITEGTSPSPNGLGYPRIPGIFSAEQVAGWKKVTAAAHSKGERGSFSSFPARPCYAPRGTPSGESPGSVRSPAVPVTSPASPHGQHR